MLCSCCLQTLYLLLFSLLSDFSSFGEVLFWRLCPSHPISGHPLRLGQSAVVRVGRSRGLWCSLVFGLDVYVTLPGRWLVVRRPIHRRGVGSWSGCSRLHVGLTIGFRCRSRVGNRFGFGSSSPPARVRIGFEPGSVLNWIPVLSWNSCKRRKEQRRNKLIKKERRINGRTYRGAL